MIRILNKEDIYAILTGETLLGAGGGGSLEVATDILSKRLADQPVSVKLIDAENISEGGSAFTITPLYETTSLTNRKDKFLHEPEIAATSIQHSAYMSGKRLEAVLPMDCGAISSLMSILCCLDSNLALVDADGCGRGVPGIDVTLFESAGIAFSPAVLCDDKGNVVRIYPYQATSGAAAANMCHYLSAAFGNVSALSAWIASPREISENLVLGSISMAKMLGSAILAAKINGNCVCEAIERTIPVRTLATGKVVDRSDSIIKLETINGTVFSADISSVTLRFRCGDEVIAVCPEPIAAVDLDKGLPVSNDEIVIGQHLRYYALHLPAQWNGRISCWKAYL